MRKSGTKKMNWVNTTLPLLCVVAYWRLVPFAVRFRMPGEGTSVTAFRAIGAGGGWSAFWRYALPKHVPGGGITDIRWPA